MVLKKSILARHNVQSLAIFSRPENCLLDCHNRQVPISYRLTGSTGGVGAVDGQLTTAVTYPSVAHGNACAITIAMRFSDL
jgi:hypothetical protein